MKIPIITGPTAVGKSEIALKLARLVDGEIISVDSMQIYTYMDIGTSKVSKEIRNEIPHHLIDIVNPDEDFDVKKFRDMALESVESIISKGKKPILAGGSGLYVEALKYGIFEGPSKNKTLRKALTEVEEESPGALRKLLFAIDPIAYEKFGKNDMIRTIRAIEVYVSTGRKISDLWNERIEDGRFITFVIERDRKELYDIIDRRVEEMFKAGFIDEVARLIDMGYSTKLKSMRSIGYKEVVQYLEGILSLEECMNEIKLLTRHYAKRQLIWFRKDENAVWLNLSEGEDRMVDKILKILNWGAL